MLRLSTSPLDMPPPLRNLTTRITAKLRITHCNPLSRTHQTSSPVESERQCHAPVLVAIRGPSLVQSSCICYVQVHLLFPPPAARYCPLLLFALHTFVKDRVGHHILRNRLRADIDILHNGLEPTFLQHVFRFRIYPPMPRSPAWLALFCHPISSMNVEPLQPSQGC